VRVCHRRECDCSGHLDECPVLELEPLARTEQKRKYGSHLHLLGQPISSPLMVPIKINSHQDPPLVTSTCKRQSRYRREKERSEDRRPTSLPPAPFSALIQHSPPSPDANPSCRTSSTDAQPVSKRCRFAARSSSTSLAASDSWWALRMDEARIGSAGAAIVMPSFMYDY